MDCLSCGTPDTRVKDAMDDGGEVKRKRVCACGAYFFSTEVADKKSLRVPGGGKASTPVSTGSNGHPPAPEKPPNESTATPLSTSVSIRGVGGAPSSDLSGSGSHSGSSLQSDPGVDRASDRWTAGTWLEKYKLAWSAKYSGSFYGQGTSDGKAMGDLSDAIAALSPAEAKQAEQRAPAMFAEYLADESPGLARNRHPFSFFVTRWNGLRVPVVDAKGAPPPSPYCEFHQQPNSRGKRSFKPLSGCPECKHVEALGRAPRSSDPSSAADLLAGGGRR